LSAFWFSIGAPDPGAPSTVLKIQKALEQAGIRFTEDEAGEIGVRLQIGNR
jgi:hypothetical protein